ncbi:MAG TPA: oligosaccharide flippase family protein [Thermoflexus sp.]|nr:oligosaccharide flippase family protein [Thermoflexus sp.]
MRTLSLATHVARSWLQRGGAFVAAVGPILLFAGLPMLLLGPTLTGSRTLIPADNLYEWQPWRAAAEAFGIAVPHNALLSDLVLENYAWKRFLVAAFRRGELPLWNPYLFAGAPFLANGQHSALYPFTVLFLIFPIHQAYGLFNALQLFLAGLGMYLLARTWGLGRAAATFAGVAYELSAFMVVSLVFPMIVAGAAWLPYLLAALHAAIERRPLLGRPAALPWALMAALALAMNILAGHVEITYYTVLVGTGYGLWRAVQAWRRQGERPASGTWARVVRSLVPLGWTGFALALGFALGAAQWVPLYEVVRENFREGTATLQQVLGWAYPWRHLVVFLIPDFYGNPSHHGVRDVFTGAWVPFTVNAYGQPNPNGAFTSHWGIKNYVEGGAYLGLLPWAFAALALIRWRSVRRSGVPLGFLVLLAALSFSFAFGLPTYALLYYGLPGINQLHSPFRWIWPFTLAMAGLAGAGFDQALRAEGRDRQWAEWGFLGVGGVVLALLGLARWAFPGEAVALADRALGALAKAPEAFPDGRMFFSYQFWNFLRFGVVAIGSGLALIALRRKPWGPMVAIGVLALDLLQAGAGFNPAADPRWLTHEPPVVRFLKQDNGVWRLTTFDPHGRKTFNANGPWLYDLQDIRGYDSIILKRYVAYLSAIQPQHELPFNRIAPITDPQALDSPLLDALNVKYVITEEAIPSPRYTLVYEGEVRVYRNEGAMPRAWTLPLTATVFHRDPIAALRQFDPRFYVVVDRPIPTLEWFGSPGTPRPAAVTAYGINEVWIDAAVEEPSWLVLADTFFPGWVAYRRPIGGSEGEEQRLEIYAADGLFRAVMLPPGRWTVRFRYSPLSVKLGFFTTFIGGMAALFTLLVWAWGRLYRAEMERSTALRVLKNSLTAMALNLLTRSIDFAFAALMLRILGPEAAGKYYFAIVLVSWYEILSNFGLNVWLTREGAKHPEAVNRYFVNSSAMRLILLAAWMPLLLAVTGVWMGAFGLTGDTALAILLLALAQVPASLATGVTALFYIYEKAEVPAALTVVTVLLKVSFGVPILLMGGGFVGLAASSVAVNLITLSLLSGIAFRMFFRPRWEDDPALRREMIRESGPLMLNHLLATLFFKIDVPILQALKGDVQVGWYSTAYKWLDALNIIPAYTTFAVFPVISRQAAGSPEAMRRSVILTLKGLAAVAVLTAVLFTFLAEPLSWLLGGAQYLPHAAIALRIMIWSIPIGWMNSLINYVLVALGRQRYQTKAFLIALGFNGIANLLTIPAFGYPAAAVITILSEIVEGMAFYYDLRRTMGPLPWAEILGRPLIAGGVMMGLTGALWGVAPALALPAGVLSYGLVWWGLRPFTPEESARIRELFPTRGIWGRREASIRSK